MVERVEPATDDSQDVREMRKICEKRISRKEKNAHEIMWKSSTDVSQFDYFVVQLFYLLSHKKPSSSRA